MLLGPPSHPACVSRQPKCSLQCHHPSHSRQLSHVSSPLTRHVFPPLNIVRCRSRWLPGSVSLLYDPQHHSLLVGLWHVSALPDADTSLTDTLARCWDKGTPRSNAPGQGHCRCPSHSRVLKATLGASVPVPVTQHDPSCLALRPLLRQALYQEAKGTAVAWASSIL